MAASVVSVVPESFEPASFRCAPPMPRSTGDRRVRQYTRVLVWACCHRCALALALSLSRSRVLIRAQRRGRAGTSVSDLISAFIMSSATAASLASASALSFSTTSTLAPSDNGSPSVAAMLLPRQGKADCWLVELLICTHPVLSKKRSRQQCTLPRSTRPMTHRTGPSAELAKRRKDCPQAAPRRG